MAFTERYVTQAAGGGGAGTSGDPWTLAEALTNATGGDRVNIQSDGAYSLGADTVSNAGSAGDLIVFRGYDTAIGDLENQGRNADGTLDVTGFPVITLTGTLTPNNFIVFHNLSFTGALSSSLIGSLSTDNVTFISCSILNSQNNASAIGFQADNSCTIINSDLECSGVSHSAPLAINNYSAVVGCRFKTVAAPHAMGMKNGVVTGSVFIGPGSGISGAYAILVFGRNEGGQVTIVNNTMYNYETAIRLINIGSVLVPTIINNHVTDCAEYINDTFATAYDTIELNNRTRDNTTPRTGTNNNLVAGEVTTDTGGPETDYTDAGADDLSLIPGAPGIDAGLGFGT